jgi:hypothetical protein
LYTISQLSSTSWAKKWWDYVARSQLRDLRLWGAITHPQARDFVNTPFDYLYQVDLQGHPMVDYLLAKSQAKCRVGYYDTSRTGLFEMMVKFDKRTTGNDLDSLIAQMVHYTQLLKVR